MKSDVGAAYSNRAAEYVALFGEVERAHEQDRELIGRWAQAVRGPVIDAGCGPGHWTDFLKGLGADVQGIDLVQVFVEHARSRFPDVPFRVASFADLGVPDGHLGGVLAWYSLIHLSPHDLEAALDEFGRSIAPGGSLLLGFFEGPDGAPFAHAVATAYFLSPEVMADRLARAGFQVREVCRRSDPGARSQAGIIACRIGPEEPDNTK
ncbi:class I SAM-dependent DNA methyltransferase [Arthrobacter sp. NPDC057013]|uniref:class I SAM-dependent DNA methyltransferase n=1 Tax=Arthrobacter sp. NPDC057013 TaxID=3345999 RepID=UPI003642C376